MIKKYFPNAVSGWKYHQLISNYPYFQKKNYKNEIQIFLFEPQFMKGILKGVGVANLSLFQGYLPSN